ncbi:Auxin-responsive protein [Quillaja saponaria]|uniref:Auxin-responsive protein n=1 Tax=Quillaja saponaria TaxID=32244 RepID=A0AAD7KSD8_QUISA|nr:Auxin-responsive protein [Quillaja saponaria]
MPKWQFVADKEMRRTPKGHFVVYVGDELKRFIVPLSYLKNPIFQKLLEKAAEEYGFNSHRSIVLPCDEIDFQRVADYLEAKKS